LFSDCTSLEECIFHSHSIQLENGVFSNCEKLSRLVVITGSREEECIIKPKWYLFSGCKSLEHVSLDPGIEVIPDGVFYGCSSLKEIHIPDGVEIIRPNAFRDCSSIRHITIPASVKRIEYWAFWGMKSLEVVDILSENVEIDSQAFRECPEFEIIRH
jgi:hypothetical protein